MTDVTVRVCMDDVDRIVRDELKEAIKMQKKTINELERMRTSKDHDDLVFAKEFIPAAAIVLRYYTVQGSDEWKELNEISNGK